MAYENLSAMFTDIASAIKEKEGSADPIPAAVFAERIRGIQTGGNEITEMLIANTQAGTIKITYTDTDGVKKSITSTANTTKMIQQLDISKSIQFTKTTGTFTNISMITTAVDGGIRLSIGLTN